MEPLLDVTQAVDTQAVKISLSSAKKHLKVSVYAINIQIGVEVNKFVVEYTRIICFFTFKNTSSLQNYFICLHIRN